jgi:hypothetical protein
MTGILNILAGSIAAAIKDGYFNLVTLLLPGNGTNGAQNNTFLDSSTNNFTITRNGNTTQGTFSPFSQTGWSNYFDGSGDYLSVPNSTDIVFGTGNFTVEAWVYIAGNSPLNGSNGRAADIASCITTGPTAGWELTIQGSSSTTGTGISFANRTSGSTVYELNYSTTVNQNQWNHIAVVRNGTTTTIYLNGTSIGSGTLGDQNISSSNPLLIGYQNATSYTHDLNGYISNFRIVKGTAVYTSNFTPSTTPLTDVTNTKLLTCQSNRFVDANTQVTAKTITIAGTPSVQAFSPFAPTAAYSAATNGGSGYFDGSGDYLNLGGQSAFAFGTGDWAIECFIYTTSSNDGAITDFRPASTNGLYPLVDIASSKFRFYTNSSTIIQSDSTISLYTWYHLVVSKASGTTRMFVNGVAQTTTYADSNNYIVGSSRPFIGVGGFNTTGFFSGYMSGLRILKGSGYSSVTVPTAPPTNITNTSLLANFTNAGITDATAKNDLETVGNAQISTTQSKFGGSSMYFDGTGGRLKALYTPNLLFLSGNFTVEMWLYKASNTAYMTACGNISTAVSNAWSVIGDATGNKITWYSNGSFVLTSTTSLSTSTWYHVAIARSGTTIKMFINGTEEASATDSLNYNVTNDVIIGHDNQLISGREWNGYIDDLRITKGYARYTASFTAPTAAFPLS